MAIKDILRNALTRQWPAPAQPQRSVITLDQYINQYLSGLPFTRPVQTMQGTVEEIDRGFAGLVTGAYQSNGVVFSAMVARQAIFSEARFQFQRFRRGQPDELFGDTSLSILERPWPGATTGDLMARAIADVDLAGNFFAVRRPGRIKRLRPDWVDIILGSENDPDIQAGDIDAEVLGYVYWPGGRYSDRDPITLLREQVAHFAPIPDPLALYRGMSWLTPIIREIESDSAATTHKNKFFSNGATPNMVVTVDIDEEKFDRWVESFEKQHAGVANAAKTLYLMAGTTAEVVGRDLKEMDFRATQGAGEVRIANAAGMHAVILGLSEGLSGSSLNQGNFMAARRLVADKTFRPLWRNFCGSMETIVPPPAGARLWYDEGGIPFLREDQKDAAEIQARNAAAIRQLVDAGFEADTVVMAVTSGDLNLLEHTGLFSVQLQPPGTVATVEPVPQLTTTEDEAGRSLALLTPYLEGPSR